MGEVRAKVVAVHAHGNVAVAHTVEEVDQRDDHNMPYKREESEVVSSSNVLFISIFSFFNRFLRPFLFLFLFLFLFTFYPLFRSI